MSARGWEEFSQKEHLTGRLRNILDDYPVGVGPFKEFLQNADDAGAHEFAVVLDKCPAPQPADPTQHLSPALMAWAGPSLLFYNSAVFSDSDFASIASLGESGKKWDRSKIGRYGLGVNVSYHFSDVLSFMSRDQIVFFDPHCQTLPDRVPGLRANFVAEKWLHRYPQTMAPFLLFGCEATAPFEGTLFRLCLRNATQAAASHISKHHPLLSQVETHLRQFAEQAPEMLLFLKNVQRVRIYFRDSADNPRLVCQISVQDATPGLMAARRSSGQQVCQKLSLSLEQTWTALDRAAPSEAKTRKQTKWLVVAGESKNSELVALANKLHATTLCGVAVPLGGQCSGVAYSFLPLPVVTGLPVHINASFALTSNRRALWSGQDKGEGTSSLKAQWNQAIFTRLVPRMWCALLTYCQQHDEPAWLRAVFPSANALAAPYREVALATLAEIRSQGLPVFYHHPLARWYRLADVVVEEEERRYGSHLRQQLGELGVFLLALPHDMAASLREAGVKYATASLDYVTAALRHRDLHWDTAMDLLTFVLLTGSTTEFRALHGLRAVPLVSRKLGEFHRQGTRGVDKGDRYFIHPHQSHLCDFLIDCPWLIESSCSVFSQLCSKTCQAETNIDEFEATALAQLMAFCVPANWLGETAAGDTTRLADQQGNLCFARPSERLSKNNQRLRLKETRRDLDKINSRLHIPAAWAPAELTPKRLCARLIRLWAFVDNMPWEQTHKLLDLWPVIPCSQNVYLTISAARQRRVLVPADFTESEYELLNSLGVLFAAIPVRPASKLALAIDSRRRDAFRALMINIRGRWPKAPAQCRSLRDLLLVWTRASNVKHNGKEGCQEQIGEESEAELVVVNPDELLEMPIFETLGGQAFVTGGAMTTPSDLGDTLYAERSVWDELLAPLMPDTIISFAGPKNQQVLRYCRLQRSKPASFLGRLCALLDDCCPQTLFVKVLQQLGQLLGQPQYRHECSLLLSGLQDRSLVVTGPGEPPRKCSSFLDPSDELLHTILLLDPDSYLAFPPPAYRQPDILPVLRQLGLQNLSHPGCFLRAAHVVARHQDVGLGRRLLASLVDSFGQRGWSALQAADLACVPFVPAVRWMHLRFPPHRQVAPLSEVSAEGSCERRKPVKARKHAASYLDDESFQEALDFDDDLDDGINHHKWGGHFSYHIVRNAAASMIAHGLRRFTEMPSSQDEDGDTVVFVPLQCSHACLWNDSWYAWRALPVLPAVLSKAPAQFYKLFNLQNPVRLNIVFSNLSSAVGCWTSGMMDRMPAAECELARGVILATLAELAKGLKSGSCLPQAVRSLLGSLPFILMDDGQFLPPQQVCVELEEDLADDLRAVPAYMADLGLCDLLVLVGSPSTAVRKAPRVRVTAAGPAALGDLVAAAFNDPALSDVRFVLDDGSCIYAHKLVLGLRSDMFYTMFSSAMREGMAMGRTADIVIPPGISGHAAEVAVRYLYLGVMKDAMLYPPSSESCELVCQVLLLADMYMLLHLKQCCEAYLAQTAQSVYNICDLLMHAQTCRAEQLVDFCIFQAQSMLSVVVKMEQWSHLSPELQDAVMRF